MISKGFQFDPSCISASLILPARQMDSPLMEAGMDSLSSVEFRNQVHQQSNKGVFLGIGQESILWPFYIILCHFIYHFIYHFRYHFRYHFMSFGLNMFKYSISGLTRRTGLEFVGAGAKPGSGHQPACFDGLRLPAGRSGMKHPITGYSPGP